MRKFNKMLRKNLKSTIWRFYGFSFFGNLHFFSAVLIPFFIQWGGISLVQVQLLQSWFALWLFILEVPTGVVADYIGRKYSLAIGGLVVTLAALVYGSIPKLGIFLLGEFLFAMALAFVSGADQALLYDSLREAGREKESKKIFGKVKSIKLISLFIATILGGFIARKFGLNAPMLFCSIPFFISALIALSIREPKVFQKESESKRYLNILKEGLSLFKKSKILKELALDGVAVASIAYFVIWFYQVILKKIGFPIAYYGVIYSILLVSEILITANFAFLEKVVGSGKRLLNVFTFLTGISFVMVAIFPSLITVILFIVLGGGFGLSRIEFMSAYFNKYIPSGQRATILSFISMFRTFILIFFNPIFGFIADRSIQTALIILGLLAFGVMIFSPLRHLNLEED